MSQVKPNQGRRELLLEKADFDLTMPKIQMIAGMTLAFIACFAAYWSSLKVGFLLDDFLHLDYVARAMHGDWQDFLHNFYGNWAGSDIMRSYRPLVSLSLFFDYLLWGTNAFGYHLTNILLLWGCALFTGLITIELTGHYGNRIGAIAGVWAALLFAVYPLHPEAATWIIGRVDLLSGLFYFASVFYYLRFRLVRQSVYLVGSIICFLGSLLSKEMAVSLPIVIALCEFVLWMPKAKATSIGPDNASWLARLKYVGIFFAVLVLFGLVRMLLLSTVIGGYDMPADNSVLGILKVFTDKATLMKIVLPINEEVKYINGGVSYNTLLEPALWVSYAVTLGLLVSRFLFRSVSLRPFIFLAAWMIVLVLPTFQVWHIYPNLVGSRLFFLSSAPFCMFLTLACLPAVDTLTKGTAKVFSVLGALALTLIFLIWSQMLLANLVPWRIAHDLMSQFKTEIVGQAMMGGDKRLLLLDLPSDYSGAGMLTRPQYLTFLARLDKGNPNPDKFLTIEPVISGSHDFMWPNMFRQMISHPQISATEIWTEGDSITDDGQWYWRGSTSAWRRSEGTGQIQFDLGAKDTQQLSFKPDNTILAQGNTWHIMSSKTPLIEKHKDFIRIYPAQQGLTIYFPEVKLDPLNAGIVTASLVKEDTSGCASCLGGKVSFVWKSLDEETEHQAPIMHGTRGQYDLWVGRYRAWTLHRPTKIGLSFAPGDYHVDLKKLSIASDVSMVPRLSISGELKDAQSLWMHTVKPSEKVQFNYDASKIANVKWVQVVISKANSTFDANNYLETEAPIPPHAIPMTEMELKQASGTFELPEVVLNSAGVHQIRVVALNDTGNIIGFPSEPITVNITK